MGLFSSLTGTGYEEARKLWDRYYNKAEGEYKNIARQGINNTAYQQALSAEKKMLEDNLNTIRSTGAITGATPAAEAIAREQAAKTIADSTAKMGANITADKNNAMAAYLNAAKEATVNKSNAAIQQAAAETQAGTQLIGSMMNMGSKMIGGI